ncbi:hypothetical protein WR25_22524 [Diploscapter pachys]|uniref:Serine/threonine-protein phosphatase n=1 Tax=Diploscapter pachys TaxID=2018661 RepID=A0A2A2JY69_9BILA|nr:hypothetical protein WR25_22524 [Diploscapter pachys]
MYGKGINSVYWMTSKVEAHNHVCNIVFIRQDDNLMTEVEMMKALYKCKLFVVSPRVFSSENDTVPLHIYRLQLASTVLPYEELSELRLYSNGPMENTKIRTCQMNVHYPKPRTGVERREFHNIWKRILKDERYMVTAVRHMSDAVTAIFLINIRDPYCWAKYITIMEPYEEMTANAMFEGAEMVTPARKDQFIVVLSWLDSIIYRLIDLWEPTVCQQLFRGAELVELCLRAREFFWANPVLREVKVPVNIAGDIHGQFEDLLTLFNINGWPISDYELCELKKEQGSKKDKRERQSERGKKNDDKVKNLSKRFSTYLFLGDYVDRGRFSVEVIVLLFALQLRYPDRIVLLRGNHESRPVNKQYGFYWEVTQRFCAIVYEVFQLPFYTMPLAALVNKRILCMHGGISESLVNFEQFNRLERPFDVPDVGIIADLVWADPEPSIDLYADSPRGAGKSFGAKTVEHFCELHKLDCIVRAHQVVQEGYEFFANRKLVTIFSAPYYCQSTLNVAAVMNVDEKMVAKFSLFRPLDGHLLRPQFVPSKQNHLATFSNAISTIEMEKDRVERARQRVHSASTIPNDTEPSGDKATPQTDDK